MYWFTFQGIDGDRDQLYNYTRDRDKAIKALGPRVLDSIVPGLSCQIPPADPNKGSLFYNPLLTQGNKDTDCSIDSSMSREERIKYALEIASASRLVEQLKLSPYSFIDQRVIDRLTRDSMDFISRKKDWSNETDRLYEPFLQISNYEELVQAASNGLNVYHSVTPASRKVI